MKLSEEILEKSGRFNKQENSFTKQVTTRRVRSLHIPARILKVYKEALLTGFTHMYHPSGLNNTLLSQVYVLGTDPSSGTVDREQIPRTKEMVRSLQLPQYSSSRVSMWSRPLKELLQHYGNRPYSQYPKNWVHISNWESLRTLQPQPVITAGLEQEEVNQIS